MRISYFAAVVLGAALFALPAGAATDPKAKAADAPQQTTFKMRSQGWLAQCSSGSRSAKPDCAVSQKIVLVQNGQLMAGITIRVPSDTRKPVMMLQAPLGLHLPSGVTLAFDKGKPVTIAMQTCNNNGCYAGQPVSDDLLKRLKTADTVAFTFQDTNRQEVKINVPLNGFAQAYEQVK